MLGAPTLGAAAAPTTCMLAGDWAPHRLPAQSSQGLLAVTQADAAAVPGAAQEASRHLHPAYCRLAH